MKTFFKTIWASFYSSDLYKKAKDEGSRFGIKFIIKLSVFIGLVLGVICLIVFLSFSSGLKKLAVNFVDKSYPNDLVVTVTDGNLTANTTLPVFIPSPVTKENVKLPKNIVALVPNEKAEASVLSKYDTMSAITSDGVIYLKNVTGLKQIEITTYGKTNQIFTKNFVLENSAKILGIITKFIAIGVIPMLIIIFLMNSFCHMLALFFIALLIYLIMRWRKLDITYKQSYRMGLYALCPLLVLQILAFPFHFAGILFDIIVVLAVILIATHKWGEVEVSTKENTIEENKID